MSEKEQDDSIDVLSKSLEATAEELDSLLRQARRHVEESLENFIQKEVWSLAAGIGHYFKLFQSYNVTSRDELENKVRKHYRESSIRESYEELLDIEREWNSFLKDVEDKAKTESESSTGPLQEGQCLPLDMTMYHFTKEVNVTLRDFVQQKPKKIDDLNGAVVVVSFTSKERTLEWKDITNCKYEILLDQERKLYKAVGLHPSVAKAWHTDMMNFYGGKKAAGETLPPPDAHEDTKQMGGNLITDCNGMLHLVYCSKTSKDRPNVSLIVDVLQKIKDLQPHNESKVK